MSAAPIVRPQQATITSEEQGGLHVVPTDACLDMFPEPLEGQIRHGDRSERPLGLGDSPTSYPATSVGPSSTRMNTPGPVWRYGGSRTGCAGVQDGRGARRSLRWASSSSATRVSMGLPGSHSIVTVKRLRMSSRLLPSW